MAWNQSEQKPPHKPGKNESNAQEIAQRLLQKLNCFADNRFHPLRFSVLLAVVLLAALSVHELPAIKQAVQERSSLLSGGGEKK